MSKIEQKYPRVGFGVMIQRPDGKVLLGLRVGSHGSGEWCFPGGSLEWGERLRDGVKRETREETGLIIEVGRVICVADELRYLDSDSKHFVAIGFLGKYLGGEPVVKAGEKFTQWQWFALDALPEKILEGTESVIKSFLAGQVDYCLKNQ